MTEAYPILENLQLSVDRNEAIPYDDEACLSGINFSKLTSLSLRGFNLQDGTFLLSVISQVYNFQFYLRQVIPSSIFTDHREVPES